MTFMLFGSRSCSLLHSTSVVCITAMLDLVSHFRLRSQARSRSTTPRCHGFEAGRTSCEKSYHDGWMDGWMKDERRFLLLFQRSEVFRMMPRLFMNGILPCRMRKMYSGEHSDVQMIAFTPCPNQFNSKLLHEIDERGIVPSVIPIRCPPANQSKSELTL